MAPVARMFTSPAERLLWNERLGLVHHAGPCDAWIHAASLGEAVAVPPFARELAALDAGAQLFLTATTRAGRARLAATGRAVALAPLDAPQVVSRFFERTRPRRIVLVETELWPHWLLHADAAGVPVVVVSGRLSARSVQRYRGLGGGFSRLMRGLAGVVCQSDRDAERWRSIGARGERVAVGGNLKFDALPEPAVSRGAARVAAGLERDRPVLVFGSLRPGEGRVLSRTWDRIPAAVKDGWQVVAVPRHPRATSELRDEAGRAVTGGDRGWRWDDRPGVLNAYYAAADVAFVGGSLADYGGHNPLEPAACGAAVIMGPSRHSQLEGVRALDAAGAIVLVNDEDSCVLELTRLLADAGARDRAAAAGHAVAVALRGSARRTVAQLVAWDLWPVR